MDYGSKPSPSGLCNIPLISGIPFFNVLANARKYILNIHYDSISLRCAVDLRILTMRLN